MTLRVAHLSDPHLGFRAYRERDRGWNLRERDVATAFHRALQRAARLRPDLVLLTGDIFHRPDPPSSALVTLTRGIRSFQSLVPSVPVLAIAGERDTPRAPGEPGSVAVLDALPGVDAAAGAARAVRFRDRGVHALLVPHRAVTDPPFPELRPDPDARYNLLLIRGSPTTDGADRNRREIAVDPGGWDYVAVGGPHRARAFHTNARAAGSLERIGWDAWSEGTEEKGFVLFDVERGDGEFHPIPVRPVVDLAPVRAGAGSPAEGTRRMRHLLEAVPGGLAGKLVRVGVEGDLLVPEEGVEAGLLEGVRREAAHLEVRVHTGAEPRPGTAGGEWAWAPRAVPSGRAEGGREPLAPGIHVAAPGTPRELDRVVARLRDLPVADGATPPGGPLHLLWAGGSPGELLRAAAELLSGAGGREVGGRGAGDRDSGGRVSQAPPGPHDEGAEPLPASVEGMRDRLRTLRGDVVEAEGELEAGMLQWARDRQEAETRLHAYRDRARELRSRLEELDRDDARCPTCDRALDEARDTLRSRLSEEWETVVQDGRWWKRRREQLEDRTPELRRLGHRALRLRSEVAELAEALEGARALQAAGRGNDGGPGAGATVAGADGSNPALPRGPDPAELAAALRPLLRRAGGHLAFWSEGALSGLRWEGAGPPRVVAAGEARAPTPGESPGLSLALHLALWEEAWLAGVPVPGGVLVAGLDDRGLDLLRPRLAPLEAANASIIVAIGPEAPLPGAPAIRGVVRLEGEGAGQLGSRPAGPASLRWIEGGGETPIAAAERASR